jgi:hypothetical protein
MKTFAISAITVAAVLAMHFAAATEPVARAFGADTGLRPIGVEAKDWISVSENLGFVVVSTVGAAKINHPKPPPGEHAQALLRGVTPPAPAAGYFMVKTAEGWRRIVVMTPSELAAIAG